jgi:hypothetical protein
VIGNYEQHVHANDVKGDDFFSDKKAVIQLFTRNYNITISSLPKVCIEGYGGLDFYRDVYM